MKEEQGKGGRRRRRGLSRGSIYNERTTFSVSPLPFRCQLVLLSVSSRRNPTRALYAPDTFILSIDRINIDTEKIYMIKNYINN